MKVRGFPEHADENTAWRAKTCQVVFFEYGEARKLSDNCPLLQTSNIQL
jgi:hypothetical protein